jgi:tetratricopeptide (TPR) repeat protein
VAKTFALAIEEAAKLHPAAEPLIIHAALLAPEPIPLFLFAEAREKFGERLALMLADDGLDEAMAALRVLALVDREVIVDERDPSIAADAIRLHRLVREVAAARCEGESRDQSWRALVAALAAVYPSDSIIGDPTSWPRCASLTPHLLSVCETEMVNAAASGECADLVNRAGEYFRVRGAYLEARPLFERALAIHEKVLGPEHPYTAMSLNNLAILLENHGDLAGSRPLKERALAIYEKVLGPEHPYTARSLNNLAFLLKAQGDLAGSRPLYERALAIFEKALGPEHPDTATSIDNLAMLLEAQGDLAAARPLVERALAIREKVLRPEHPDTASNLSNLARVLSKSGHRDDAELLFKRAIAIGERALGPGHPLTQRYRSHCARLFLDTGRHAEALSLARAALATHETASGPNHPWTKDSARVTAEALDAHSRTEEAAELRARYGIDGP